MGIFDALSDPNVMTLLGAAQGFGEAAMPSRVKLPLGAVLGMGGAGAMKGMASVPEFQKAQASAEMARNQAAVQRAFLGQLAPGAQGGGAPMSMSGASPISMSGPTSQAPSQGQGGPGAAPQGPNGFLLSPADALRFAQIAAAGNMPELSKTYLESAYKGFQPNTTGGQSFVPGGPEDPQTKLAQATATFFGGHGLDASGKTLPNVNEALFGQEASKSAGTETGKVPGEEQLSAFQEAQKRLTDNNRIMQEAGTRPVQVSMPDGSIQNMTALQFGNWAGMANKPIPPAVLNGDQKAVVSATTGSAIPKAPAPQAAPGVASPNPEWLKSENTMNQGAAANSAAQAQMDATIKALTMMESNPVINIQKEIYPMLHGVGIDVDPAKMQNVEQAQTILHGTMLQAMETLKANATGGTRWTQREWERLIGAMNNPELTPGANRNIAAQVMATLKAEQSMRNSWPEAKSMGWKNPDEYGAAWVRENPVQGFVDQELKNLPLFKGMPGWQQPGGPTPKRFNWDPTKGAAVPQ